MTSEFRMIPVGLLAQKRFRDVSPIAKAAYMALRLRLPTTAIGYCGVDGLHSDVGCSADELRHALDGLSEAGLLDRDDDHGVYWLRGLEGTLPWTSPKFRKRWMVEIDDLPPSPLVGAFLADIAHRTGVSVTEDADLVSIQKRKQEQRTAENSKADKTLGKEKRKDEGQSPTSKERFRLDQNGERASTAPPRETTERSTYFAESRTEIDDSEAEIATATTDDDEDLPF